MMKGAFDTHEEIGILGDDFVLNWQIYHWQSMCLYDNWLLTLYMYLELLNLRFHLFKGHV